MKVTNMADQIGLVFIIIAILNIIICMKIYRSFGLASPRQLLAFNTAAVDVILTIRDLPAFLELYRTGNWRIADRICDGSNLKIPFYMVIISFTAIVLMIDDKIKMAQVRGITGAIVVFVTTTLSPFTLVLVWSKYEFLQISLNCNVETIFSLQEPTDMGRFWYNFAVKCVIASGTLLTLAAYISGSRLNIEKEGDQDNMNEKEQSVVLKTMVFGTLMTIFFVFWIINMCTTSYHDDNFRMLKRLSAVMTMMVKALMPSAFLMIEMLEQSL